MRLPRAELGLAFGTLDAGLSSLGNVAVTISAANVLQLRDFGSLALCMTVAVVLLGVSRVSFVDPFVLRSGASSPAELRREATRVAFQALLLASCASALLLLLCLLLGTGVTLSGQLSIAFIGVWPLLVFQDTIRWICYPLRVPKLALVNTLIWTVSTLSGIVLLGLLGRISAVGLLVTWGATAGISGAISAAIARISIRPCSLRQVDRVGVRRSWIML